MKCEKRSCLGDLALFSIVFALEKLILFASQVVVTI